MAELNVTEQDLAEVLKARVNEVTNLQVQVAALSRTVNELSAKLDESDKEADNAESG